MLLLLLMLKSCFSELSGMVALKRRHLLVPLNSSFRERLLKLLYALLLLFHQAGQLAVISVADLQRRTVVETVGNPSSPLDTTIVQFFTIGVG